MMDAKYVSKQFVRQDPNPIENKRNQSIYLQCIIFADGNS
jgi:hypothetical protein